MAAISNPSPWADKKKKKKRAKNKDGPLGSDAADPVAAFFCAANVVHQIGNRWENTELVLN